MQNASWEDFTWYKTPILHAECIMRGLYMTQHNQQSTCKDNTWTAYYPCAQCVLSGQGPVYKNASDTNSMTAWGTFRRKARPSRKRMEGIPFSLKLEGQDWQSIFHPFPLGAGQITHALPLGAGRHGFSFSHVEGKHGKYTASHVPLTLKIM